jgi:hypothetical protein
MIVYSTCLAIGTLLMILGSGLKKVEIGLYIISLGTIYEVFRNVTF